jgi:D-alanyl-D-alanine carboxypeptidase
MQRSTRRTRHGNRSFASGRLNAVAAAALIVGAAACSADPDGTSQAVDQGDFGPSEAVEQGDLGPTESTDPGTTTGPEVTDGGSPIPDTASVDRDQLGETLRRIIGEFGLPGAVVQVRVDGQQPTTAAAGVADVVTQQPIEETDQLRVYSVTKTVTALIVLQLVEEGTLSLDQTVDEWLPESVVGDVPHSSLMTIRHLLTHSSGVADFHDAMNPGDEIPPFVSDLFAQAQAGEFHWYSPEELIAYSTRFDPSFPPGEGAAYSNTGYVMLGLVIEAATGKKLEDEMNTRVFEPLNLTSTYLETATTPNDYVAGYQTVGQDQLVSLAGSNSSFAWAAGGLISTVDDVGRLAEAIFTGELLTDGSYVEMFTFVPDPHRDDRDYGMGVFRIRTPAGAVNVISGGAGGYTATGIHHEDSATTIVGMFNRNDADPALEAMVDEVLELTAR